MELLSLMEAVTDLLKLFSMDMEMQLSQQTEYTELSMLTSQE